MHYDYIQFLFVCTSWESISIFFNKNIISFFELNVVCDFISNIQGVRLSDLPITFPITKSLTFFETSLWSFFWSFRYSTFFSVWTVVSVCFRNYSASDSEVLNKFTFEAHVENMNNSTSFDTHHIEVNSSDPSKPVETAQPIESEMTENIKLKKNGTNVKNMKKRNVTRKATDGSPVIVLNVLKWGIFFETLMAVTRKTYISKILAWITLLSSHGKNAQFTKNHCLRFTDFDIFRTLLNYKEKSSK